MDPLYFPLKRYLIYLELNIFAKEVIVLLTEYITQFRVLNFDENSCTVAQYLDGDCCGKDNIDMNVTRISIDVILLILKKTRENCRGYSSINMYDESEFAERIYHIHKNEEKIFIHWVLEPPFPMAHEIQNAIQYVLKKKFIFHHFETELGTTREIEKDFTRLPHDLLSPLVEIREYAEKKGKKTLEHWKNLMKDFGYNPDEECIL